MAVQTEAKTAHNENEKSFKTKDSALERQQKLLPLRPRRIVEESQLRDVQCRLPLLLPPDLELGTEGKGKYEEKKKKRKREQIPKPGGRRRYL